MLKNYFRKKRLLKLIEQKEAEEKGAVGLFQFIPSKYYSEQLYIARKQLEMLRSKLK
jgi:hypothetical protein